MYYHRHLEEKIAALAPHFKVLLLLGARQVGKSTLLQHNFPEMKHLTFDPLRDIYDARKDPDLFFKNFPAPVILDEIQYAPEILSTLKRVVDQSPLCPQYLLTGSQNFSMMRNSSESLAGRVGILQLYGMTPYEYNNAKDQHWLGLYLEDPSALLKRYQGTLKTDKTLYQQLWYGCLPKAQSLPADAIPVYFDGYIRTYLERDVRLLENVSDLDLFDRFIGLLAALSAQEINHSQLGRELGMTHTTTQRWLNILKYSYLWYEARPFTQNMIKRVSQRPKGYFADTGLICALHRITHPDQLGRHPMLGSIFETFCHQLILGLSQSLPIRPNIYHWRSQGGAEVDLILEYNARFYPIEVKCKSLVSRRDASGIKAFRAANPSLNIAPGLVLYVGEEMLWIDDDLIACPWNALIK
jgi:predicted AAA+ superfamily ATPase